MWSPVPAILGRWLEEPTSIVSQGVQTALAKARTEYQSGTTTHGTPVSRDSTTQKFRVARAMLSSTGQHNLKMPQL